jgi:hypothetical protein
MAYVVNSFDRYVLYYVSGASPAVGVPHEAEIDLFDGSTRAGILYFHPDGATLPANRETVNGIYAYYHLSRFADVIETLREEKPLYMALNTGTGVAYIGSSAEPIGEEEGS